ncbi:MAG: hypothetical protein AB8F95_06885 [Bacteroidia bacterium]
MSPLKKIIAFILGAFMILAGVTHLVNPGLSSGLIPDFLPETLVHIIFFIIEAGLGIAVFVPKWRNKALLGIFILMIFFLPIHIIDVTRDQPVIGSFTAAVIRIPIQLLFIFLAWFAKGKSV